MKAYCYDNDYNFACEVDCFLDPLESEKQGTEIYLLPANSTFAKVPEFNTKTQYAEWKKNTWEIKEIPTPEPIEPTQAEQREKAYQTMRYKTDNSALIIWESKALTVDEANKA